MSLFQRVRRGLFGIALPDEVTPPMTFAQDLALLWIIAGLGLLYMAGLVTGREW